MAHRLAALFIAAALMPWSAASAQAPAAPDPAALDLARVLMARDPSLYDDADIVRFQARIERALTGANDGCDPFHSECRAAAADVAREFAPAYRAAERARTERITAFLLADMLRPDEMARIAQYLRSAEGGRFLNAWALLRDRDRSRQRRRELERQLDRTVPDALAAARARFRQRTRNLPRAVVPR